MGYSYWATKTKRTNTEIKLMVSAEIMEQKTRGWGHQGRGFAAGGRSVPQPLTHGKDPGLKKACGGETSISSLLPPPPCHGFSPKELHCFVQCYLNVYSYSQVQQADRNNLSLGWKYFYLLEMSQCCSECGCLSKVHTLECKGLDYIHCNLSLLSADDLFNSL